MSKVIYAEDLVAQADDLELTRELSQAGCFLTDEALKYDVLVDVSYFVSSVTVTSMCPMRIQ